MSCGLQVTIVAESFGGCLGLRVAAAAPELVERLVLVNPATSFARALGGLPGVIAGTNLLSLFPEPLYQVRPGCHRLPAMHAMLYLGPAVMKLQGAPVARSKLEAAASAMSVPQQRERLSSL